MYKQKLISILLFSFYINKKHLQLSVCNILSYRDLVHLIVHRIMSIYNVWLVIFVMIYHDHSSGISWFSIVEQRNFPVDIVFVFEISSSIIVTVLTSWGLQLVAWWYTEDFQSAGIFDLPFNSISGEIISWYVHVSFVIYGISVTRTICFNAVIDNRTLPKRFLATPINT